ncbi:hypothetical protein AGMMS49938_09330 [Fibrobacterales bacterium]|nr:hypothetical protein AGMMS49938_09330 [Fibrobacterales bacterium]
MALVANIPVNSDIKFKAERLFASFGITLDDAVSLFLLRSLEIGAIPFRVAEPKKESQTDLAKQAFQNLQKIKKSLPSNFDYKAELQEAKSEKYGDFY